MSTTDWTVCRTPSAPGARHRSPTVPPAGCSPNPSSCRRPSGPAGRSPRPPGQASRPSCVSGLAPTTRPHSTAPGSGHSRVVPTGRPGCSSARGPSSWCWPADAAVAQHARATRTTTPSRCGRRFVPRCRRSSRPSCSPPARATCPPTSSRRPPASPRASTSCSAARRWTTRSARGSRHGTASSSSTCHRTAGRRCFHTWVRRSPRPRSRSSRSWRTTCGSGPTDPPRRSAGRHRTRPCPRPPERRRHHLRTGPSASGWPSPWRSRSATAYTPAGCVPANA
jgi:hypothetical protein